MAVVPTSVDFVEFSKAIEEQRVQTELEAATHQPAGRRRSSVQGPRPVFKFTKKARQPKIEIKKDEDGWVTLNKKKLSFGAEEAQAQKENFRQEIKDQSINKIRVSTKKMASANSGGGDLLSDRARSKFNAFAALNSEDEGSE